jgi:hypothetical protein
MYSQRISRTLGVLTLLALISLQWLAGNLCLSKTTYIVLAEEMDKTEQAIAGEVFDQVGVRTSVKTVTPEEIANLHLLGYAAPFIHTIQLADEDLSFTLDGSPSRTEAVIVHVDTSDPEQKPVTNHLQPDRLFAQFCIPLHALSDNIRHATHVKNFSVQSMYDRYEESLTSPPPRGIS